MYITYMVSTNLILFLLKIRLLLTLQSAVSDVTPKIVEVNDSILIINKDKNIIIDKIHSSSSIAEASEDLNASATAHILKLHD